MFDVTACVLWFMFGVTECVSSVATKKTKLVPVDMNSEVVREWMEQIVPNRRDLYTLGCDKTNMTHQVRLQGYS